MRKIFFTIILFIFLFNSCSAQEKIHPISQTDWNKKIQPNNELIKNIINLSKSFTAQTKLAGIGEGKSSQAFFRSAERWPSGSWFRGYYTDFETNNETRKSFYEGKWSSHPQARSTAIQIRALMQYDDYYGTSTNSSLIVDGVNYLISQQVKNLKDKTQNGGFIYWYQRDSSNKFENADLSTNNKVHIYETGNALAAMCDAVQYFNKNNILLPASLMNSINRAAMNINDVNTAYNSENYVGLGLWGMSKAYKLTNNKTYLNNVIKLSNWIIDRQTTKGLCQGTWQSGKEDFFGESVYHESRSGYHVITLRALLEAYSALPYSYKEQKSKIKEAQNKAINHIIDYRINFDSKSSFFGTMSTFFTDTNCNVLKKLNDGAHYSFMYEGDLVEAIAMATCNAAKDSTNYSLTEVQSLRKLLNIISIHAQTRIDPAANNQGALQAVKQMPSLAFYLNYSKAIDSGKNIF